MKSILTQVIANVKPEKDGFCTIKHKRGWNRFLEDGNLPFQPHELRQILEKVISTEGLIPRGDKLLHTRQTYNFTITNSKAPYRKEEALERFIIASNPPNSFFNQIPVGGGKESIDIGIKESDKRFIFIELKPWSSNNSPLYAIIESLKNLTEYRMIKMKKIKHNPSFKDYTQIDLIVLAPKSYYQYYNMIDSSTGLHREDKISILKRALDGFSNEFKTNISLMMLPLEEKAFLNMCMKVCNDKKTVGQQMITISQAYSIPALARDQWKMLVSSDWKFEH